MEWIAILAGSKPVSARAWEPTNPTTSKARSRCALLLDREFFRIERGRHGFRETWAMEQTTSNWGPPSRWAPMRES
jgi:hypothetical protein